MAKWWPKTLQEVAVVIGEAETEKLAVALGGLRVYVPAIPTAKSPLLSVISKDALDKLARIYGGSELEVPNTANSKAQKIKAMLGSGMSRNEVATATGSTERYVRMVANSGHSQSLLSLPLD